MKTVDTDRLAEKRAAAKGKPEQFPKMSPWGREFMKRLEKLHKVLASEGKKLA